MTENRISPMLPKHPKSERAPERVLAGAKPVLTAASLALGGPFFQCKAGTWAGRGE